MAGDDRPIFLVGFMGSGKTTVGRLVAGRLGWAFCDLDDLVVEREGRPIAEIFRDAGEAAFRLAERSALETLDGRRRLVVATGGGLFADAGNRGWVGRHGQSVWLDLPLSQCLARIGDPAARPLWDPRSDPRGFRALFEKRRAAYALAGLRVDASGPAERVAEALLRGLGRAFP